MRNESTREAPAVALRMGAGTFSPPPTLFHSSFLFFPTSRRLLYPYLVIGIIVVVLLIFG